MRVLLLSPYSEKLVPTLEAADDTWFITTEPLTDDLEADWLVSYGYRHIIREPYLSKFKNRIINVHISMLPWNRGSDPNFWSWFDQTPKGVSIHYIDAGLDTGPILYQAAAKFSDQETLRTSYDVLREAASNLFGNTWRSIRTGRLPGKMATHRGTYHRSSDKNGLFSALPFGIDTPVSIIEKMNTKMESA